jgi:GMP synthase-like glutamine amidotransferase
MRVLCVVHERDAGSGVFAQVTAERADELTEWIPAEEPAPELRGFDAVLVFGGGMHVDQEDDHPWLRAEKQVLRALLDERAPVLGVCLGAQLLAEAALRAARRLTGDRLEAGVAHARGRRGPGARGVARAV